MLIMNRVVRDGKAGGETRVGHLGQGGDGGQADERGHHAQVRRVRRSTHFLAFSLVDELLYGYMFASWLVSKSVLSISRPEQS